MFVIRTENRLLHTILDALLTVASVDSANWPMPEDVIPGRIYLAYAPSGRWIRACVTSAPAVGGVVQALLVDCGMQGSFQVTDLRRVPVVLESIAWKVDLVRLDRVPPAGFKFSERAALRLRQMIPAGQNVIMKVLKEPDACGGAAAGVVELYQKLESDFLLVNASLAMNEALFDVDDAPPVASLAVVLRRVAASAASCRVPDVELPEMCDEFGVYLRHRHAPSPTSFFVFPTKSKKRFLDMSHKLQVPSLFVISFLVIVGFFFF